MVATADASNGSSTSAEVDEASARERPNQLSRSAPASTNCLLGNFEVSAIRGTRGENVKGGGVVRG